jgi:hypothetical protein
MVYQNVLGIQGYGLEGYPKHSLANTGCKHFSAFDGPMNWSENGLGLCPLFMIVYVKMIVLPRQARDKHRESTLNKKNATAV